MKDFNYFQPTRIHFGCGRIREVGAIVAGYGSRCLLVTVPAFPAFVPLIERVSSLLREAGVEVAHFDGVIPNPTVDSVRAGAEAARAHRADVVLGVGGGSSMDTAKAIAVEATHPGSCWDYLFYRDTQPTAKTLPIVAVSTTSGTGSQVTQVAVVTNTQTRDKSAIYHPLVFPRAAVVDPELMFTVPGHVSASTGFDAFCHAFESYIHPAASPLTDGMALDAMRLVIGNLPAVLNDGRDAGARSALAWADTLAGLCIANAGVTLPHGIGMAISGMYPQVMHGESLAISYPAFLRCTWSSAVDRFAAVARLFDPVLADAADAAAAEALCDLIPTFLDRIGMACRLSQFEAPREELPALARQSLVLPDYKNNPKVVDYDEMLALLTECY